MVSRESVNTIACDGVIHGVKGVSQHHGFAKPLSLVSRQLVNRVSRQSVNTLYDEKGGSPTRLSTIACNNAIYGKKGVSRNSQIAIVCFC